ncbi:DUF2809 domain-containing protein [Bradyrhizobium sp. dw_411]|uniref:ribosomal maturation YjgA family protein n=1 Tax=Bradyrhizobium sp. dw_411 TaxID=2720082 RepID=UPI001BCDB6B0|nr:DUF2809 domain-containing protein [Bradyrhizobium sp. dw_411]
MTASPAFFIRAGLCLLIIVSGLALRGLGFSFGLSAFVVKYGGSLLWAAMVFFLVAMAASHSSRLSVGLISAAIAIGVELFRLIHAPWLDAFRLTLPGALLLGRIFSLWNMLAYGVGIIFAVGLDRMAVDTLAARLRGHAGAR